MQTQIPSDFQCANVHMDAFHHVWEPWLPSDVQWSSESNGLPPPFDAWGPRCAWKLVSCNVKHEGSCIDFTVERAEAQKALKGLLLKNFNVVFGVTRNKQFASAFRAKKAAQKAAEEEEEEEEDQEEEDEEEEEHEEGEEEEAEEEEEEEDDEIQEEEDEDEEEDCDADEDHGDGEEEESEESSSESSVEEFTSKTKRKAVVGKSLPARH